MSSSDYREPTNDELWAQPPAASRPGAGPPQGVSPLPHVPVPASLPTPPPPPSPQARPDRTVFVLAILSLALGIPLTAIAARTGGLAGLLIVWVGIVLVNAVYAWSRTR